MGTFAGKLCKRILEDDFGSIVAQVGSLLISKGRHSVLHLRKALPDLSALHIYQALFILMQHNVVKYAEQEEAGGQRVVNYYSVDIEATLLRLRLPFYINVCRLLRGEPGEEVAFAVAQHGKVRADFFAEKDELVSAFDELVKQGFLEPVKPSDTVSMADKRIAYVRNGMALKPGATALDKKKLVVAAEAITDFSTDDTAGSKRPSDSKLEAQNCKRPKAQNDCEELMYTFEDSAFRSFFLKHTLLKIVKARVNPSAAKLVDYAYQLAYHESKAPYKNTSRPGKVLINHLVALLNAFEPTTRFELIHASGERPPGLQSAVIGYMDTMSLDSFKQSNMRNLATEHITPSRPTKTEAFLPIFQTLEKGVEYALDFEHAVEYLKRRIVETMVSEAFGQDGLMVWRCLLMSGKLEEKGILNRCLLSPSSVRALLFSMLKHDFVQTLDVPKVKDHTKNFYMWYIDFPRILQRVTDRLHATASRLMQRLFAEDAQHKALAEKLRRDDVKGNLALLPEFEQRSWRRYAVAKELLTANLLKVDIELLILRDLGSA